MRRLFKLGTRTILVVMALVLLVAGAVWAADIANSPGPAPNSGDCIPDHSGFDLTDRPFGESGVGPAPNAGDGIPDGSGF